jgi:hypothetical protein
LLAAWVISRGPRMWRQTGFSRDLAISSCRLKT